ncbi:bifunctional lytic transglycosylase/C40 family peptidase [Streptodolium elevatio]|uniref:Bifunctional lytic transglycosylase/C40 family peptidase n=1 Tax=Streptodolium elevatio TaxID=3157996 RepID=A0ABV3DAC8_9ACTN
MGKAVTIVLATLLLGIVLVAAMAASLVGMVGRLFTGFVPGANASAQASSDIPADYLTLYQQAAATCPGLPWAVLAAIGKIESDHGRAPDLVSDAGALGPMQFIADTWAQYGQGGSVWKPADAIPAAARYLCASGARDGKDIRGAIFAYNHADWYVDKVLTQAAAYTAAPSSMPGSNAGSESQSAAIAIAFARAQIGTPYVWGGDGPTEGGFDCSGLTKAAYAAAGITIPRVAQDQFRAGPQVPYGAPLLPGDLVFYGTATNIHHVGIYTGNGLMIDAPHPGALTRETRFRWPGDDYFGASRPGK